MRADNPALPSHDATPAHIRVPLARLLERVVARLDDDQRRGLEAEGHREADPSSWGRWADDYRFTLAREALP
jgi:hypothetical protein